MLGRVSPPRTIWTICRKSYCSPGVEQIIQVGRRRPPARPSSWDPGWPGGRWPTGQRSGPAFRQALWRPRAAARRPLPASRLMPLSSGRPLVAQQRPMVAHPFPRGEPVPQPGRPSNNRRDTPASGSMRGHHRCISGRCTGRSPFYCKLSFQFGFLLFLSFPGCTSASGRHPRQKVG